MRAMREGQGKYIKLQSDEISTYLFQTESLCCHLLIRLLSFGGEECRISQMRTSSSKKYRGKSKVAHFYSKHLSTVCMRFYFSVHFLISSIYRDFQILYSNLIFILYTVFVLRCIVQIIRLRVIILTIVYKRLGLIR